MSEQKTHRTQIAVALIGAIAIIIAATIGVVPKLIESTSEPVNSISEKTKILLPSSASKTKQVLANSNADDKISKIQKKEKLVLNRYLDNKDGTVTDTNYNKMWQKCYVGLHGKNCDKAITSQTGVPDLYTNSDEITESFVGGYTDWRIPTLREYTQITYCMDGTPILESESLCSHLEKTDFDILIDMRNNILKLRNKIFPNSTFTWYAPVEAGCPAKNNELWKCKEPLLVGEGHDSRGKILRMVRDL